MKRYLLLLAETLLSFSVALELHKSLCTKLIRRLIPT